MHTYIAFLRGINVGGKGLIKMAELRECLIKHGFANVCTYIQSGNVVFQSDSTDKNDLADTISSLVNKTFDISAAVVVFSDSQWKEIIEKAPAWWGKNDTWKHNILIMTEAYNVDDAVTEIGVLKPDIESIAPGKGVIYQSISWQDFSRARSGRLASLPIYKKMTIRNYNTLTWRNGFYIWF